MSKQTDLYSSDCERSLLQNQFPQLLGLKEFQ